MLPETTTAIDCEECQGIFQPTFAEGQILKKVFSPSYPIPKITKCPSCRMRQRLAFRNEHKLYRGVCDKSGKQMVSIYRPDSGYTVYEQSIWWSDDYDPLEYGQDFDFTRPFFEQFEELNRVVPKLSIHNAKSENCDYTNYSSENRNSYLLVGGLRAEDCYYCYRVFHSKNLVDCFALSKSELCYESLQGSELYRCFFTINCQNSSDLYLCDDCIGCKNCFGCINLRNQEYFIFNQSHSPEEYAQKLSTLKQDFLQSKATFESLKGSLPVRSSYIIGCEDCSGDQLRNCKRCSECYFLSECEDVFHSRNGEGNRDCADLNFGDGCELQYQTTNLRFNYRVAFAALAWYTKESFYILSCFNSNNLFGCTGMKGQQYCILNKQYTPEDYFQIVTKIILHMEQTGEWGRFFPPAISPFLFSETIAAEIFPLTDKELANRSYNVGGGRQILLSKVSKTSHIQLAKLAQNNFEYSRRRLTSICN